LQHLATYAGFNKYDFTICNLILSKETLIHCDFTFRGAKEAEQRETRRGEGLNFPEARNNRPAKVAKMFKDAAIHERPETTPL
jgi:hypothetical protein